MAAIRGEGGVLCLLAGENLLTYFEMCARLIIFLLLAAFFPLKAEDAASETEQAVRFVLSNMPEKDKKILSEEWVRQDVQRALSARGRFVQDEQIPDEIYREYVLPYAVINESRGDWRSVLEEKYGSIAKACRTAEEAVWRIVSHMTEDTGVIYSRERRHPVMSALEALAEKKVSCTGQSILVVCALRSVGIPARAVGVASWNHIPGNHTWAEAWYNGGWHMVEFNEKEENTPWVMENIGLLDPQSRFQQIIAATWSPKSEKTFFPVIPCGFAARCVFGENVTERYTTLARQWYEKNGLSHDVQRLFVEVLSPPRNQKCERVPAWVELRAPDGSLIDEGVGPGPQDDMREYLRLSLPRLKGYTLRVYSRRAGELLATCPIEPNEGATRLIRLTLAETPSIAP